ncbi:MAG: tagaturonate reductase, partial [Lachnospiraceae bacterium]|nr:tagaturonate reductase [Lachnospiraceae bacterium]
MERISTKMTGKKERPIKVVQFGEGNFLRAFVDYMIDIANENGYFNGDVVIVKP